MTKAERRRAEFERIRCYGSGAANMGTFCLGCIDCDWVARKAYNEPDWEKAITMTKPSVQERQERAEELESKKQQLTDIVNDAFASPEEIESATAALQEIENELIELAKMEANHEVFADGAHIDNQFADASGGTFVDNGEGYLEPDLTSQSTADGGSVKPEEVEVKKPDESVKEVKKRLGKSPTTPGYNAKVLPDGKVTFVVGPKAPDYGYPPMPAYSDLYDHAIAKGMDEKNLKELYATAERLLAEKFPEACKPDSPDNLAWHEIVLAKAKDMVDAYTAKPAEMTEGEKPEDESGLIKIAREIFGAGEDKQALPYAPAAVKAVMARLDLTYVDSKTMPQFRQELHIELKNIMEGVTYFLGDWTQDTTMEQLDKYADKILGHSERVDRIKQQYDRLVAQEAAYIEFAETYLNPEFLPFIQEQIKNSGKKVKYFDTLIARYQTKTYGSKFKLSSPEKIAEYLKPLSDKALSMIGAAREIIIKYDTKKVVADASDGSPVWPMSAFTKGSETTKLYIQGLKSKE